MRNCPHCHKEIQDEASFCRFCRRDVEPPLWLTSLQKCPFCAEWVERGIDRCPLCGKDLSTSKPFSIPTAEAEEASDLLSRLRKSTFKLEEIDQEEDEEQGSADLEEDEPAVEPFVDTPSWFQRMRKPAEPRTAEAEEGLGVLQSRRIDLRDDVDREQEPDSQDILDEQAAPQDRNWGDIGGKILRWVLIAVIASLFVIVAVLGYDRISSSAGGTPAATSTKRPTASHEQTHETTLTPAPTYSGTPGVLLPVTPSGPECISWENVTLDMVGETLCVYGDLKRWFQVTDIPYVAIFSEDPGTFAFIDREQTYPQFRPGMCITAQGVIEDMRSTRPFIDVMQNLKECEPTP
jgi:RNA polymerase subunit RPABC4/transcription elongation factor Spt4